MKLLKRFFNDEEGATLVEYALLIAFIALVAVFGVNALGDQINDFFTAIGNALSGAATDLPN